MVKYSFHQILLFHLLHPNVVFHTETSQFIFYVITSFYMKWSNSLNWVNDHCSTPLLMLHNIPQCSTQSSTLKEQFKFFKNSFFLQNISGGCFSLNVHSSTTSGQCFIAIPSKNIKKALTFWCFQGVQKRNIDQNDLKKQITKPIKVLNVLNRFSIYQNQQCKEQLSKKLNSCLISYVKNIMVIFNFITFSSFVSKCVKRS